MVGEPDRWPDGRVKWSCHDFPCRYCGERLGGEVSLWCNEMQNGVMRGLGWYHERCGVKYMAPVVRRELREDIEAK